MGFPRRLLNDDEDVVAEIRPHWMFMGAPIASSIVVIVGTIALVVRVPSLASWAILALLSLIVVTSVWLALRFASWASTGLVVTTRRLVFRRGVVSRWRQEIPIDRIVDVSSTQSILERILGSGSLVVESGGEVGQGSLVHVPRPTEVQSLVHDQMSKARAAESARRWGSPAASIPDQIEKLDELCRRGVITRDEFESKKAELLDRL